MTADAPDLSSLTTSQLVERFSAAACRIGNPQRPFASGNLKAGTPEFTVAGRDLKAASRELRNRNAVAEVLPLMESEHDPVRAFASTHFRAFDPKLEQAAFFAVNFERPTREAVALTALARSTQAEVPDQSEWTDDQLVANFVEASMRLDGTRFLDPVGDPDVLELRNRIVPHVWAPARELKSRGALARLIPLMDHPNGRLRLNAAIGCLRLKPEQAAAILETFAKPGLDQFDTMDARRSLEFWRQGGPVVWGVV